VDDNATIDDTCTDHGDNATSRVSNASEVSLDKKRPVERCSPRSGTAATSRERPGMVIPSGQRRVRGRVLGCET
jgi:hypothetical protein